MMNKSKIIFLSLAILIFGRLVAVAQPTPVPGENCDKPQTCNDSAGFNYVFCKPGSMGTPDSLIMHCSKNPNNQRDWAGTITQASTQMRICVFPILSLFFIIDLFLSKSGVRYYFDLYL